MAKQCDFDQIATEEAPAQDPGSENVTQEETAQLRTFDSVTAVGRKRLSTNYEVFTQTAPSSIVTTNEVTITRDSDGYPETTRTDVYSQDRVATEVADGLRYEAGKYWTLTEAETVKYLNHENFGPKYRIIYGQPENIPDHTMYGKTQLLNLKANQTQFLNAQHPNTEETFSSHWWHQYIRGGEFLTSMDDDGAHYITYPNPLTELNTTYYDYTYELACPFSKKELELLENIPAPVESSIETEYNFFIKPYEEGLAHTRVVEPMMPNLYAISAVDAEVTENPHVINHVSLGGQLAEDEEDTYFTSWVESYRDAVRAGETAMLRAKFSNIAVPHENINLLTDFHDKKELFPMYIATDFTTDQSTTFAEALKDSKLDKNLMKTVVYNIAEVSKGNTPTATYYSSKPFVENLETRYNASVNNNFVNIAVKKELIQAERSTWDITEWWHKHKANHIDYSTMGQRSVFMGKPRASTGTPSEACDAFSKSINSIIFFGKLRNLVKDKSRTFKEVLSGQKAYSETVMYRIAKYRGDGSGSPIQNFYFPNSNLIDIIDYIDTQVKYDQQYTYKVFAYQLVIGTKYHYTAPPSYSTADFQLGERYGDGIIDPTLGPDYADSFGNSYWSGRAVPEERGGTQTTETITLAHRAHGNVAYGDSQYVQAYDPNSFTNLLWVGYHGTVYQDAPSDADIEYDYLKIIDSPNNHLDNQEFIIRHGYSTNTTPMPDLMRLEIDSWEDVFGSEVYDQIGAQGASNNYGPITYELWAHPYSNLIGVDEEEGLASLTVNWEPSILLVETPYYEFTTRVVDNPSPHPNVNIVPYRAVSDKIMILLDTNVDEFKADPILIEDSDAEYIQKVREAKNLDENEKILYKTDDPAQEFQIYRIDKIPTKYEDFANKMIATVSVENGSAATYIDTSITANKKYYYTFRALDAHGNISQPAPIYEIEIIEDQGTTYPIINVIELGAEDTKDIAKPMKRYLFVGPASLQALINQEKTGIANVSSAHALNNITLGMADESAWGKKFKIRLTSRQTGKKFDINVEFKNMWNHNRGSS